MEAMEMTCPECKSLIRPGKGICPQCGFPLGNPVEPDHGKSEISALAEDKYRQAAGFAGEKQWKTALPLIRECLALFPRNEKYLLLKKQVRKNIRRKRWRRFLMTTGIVILVLAASGVTGYLLYLRHLDSEAWQAAGTSNTVEAYRGYLNEHPGGRFAAIAENTIQSLIKKEEDAWTAAQTKNTIGGFRDFLAGFPASRHTGECQEKLEFLIIQQWAGFFYYEDDTRAGPGYEMEIRTDFSCFIRNSAGNSATGKARAAGDKLEIFLPTGDFFSANNTTKPALILSFTDGNLFSEMPQSYSEADRLPHQFFIRKPDNVVTTYERSFIQLLVNRYYTAVVGKAFASVADFFVPIVRQYYSVKDISKEQIIQLQREYWTDSEIYGATFRIEFSALKVARDKNGNFVVRFPLEWNLDRADKSKYNQFRLAVEMTLTRDFMIERISDRTIERHRSY